VRRAGHVALSVIEVSSESSVTVSGQIQYGRPQPALPGQLGDVHDFVAEQYVAQRLDDLYGGVFVDEETHHAARGAGSKLST
jgi:hypothetical protein